MVWNIEATALLVLELWILLTAAIALPLALAEVSLRLNL